MLLRAGTGRQEVVLVTPEDSVGMIELLLFSSPRPSREAAG
jgi:hypothetical protein